MAEIDLSFTSDPQWISEREKVWDVWHIGLEKEMNADQLAKYKHYFFSGEVLDGAYISDEGLFESFPLQNEAGWNYVLSYLMKDASEFNYLIKETFQDRSDEEIFPHRAPNELARWEYFLVDSFELLVKSKVPIRQAGICEIELDPYDTFCRISTGILGFLERGKGGDWPKWVRKQDYYWSIFPYIDDTCFSAKEFTDKSDAAYFLKRLFDNFVSLKIKTDYIDQNNTRPKFFKMMEEKMDGMYSQLCPKVQQLWDEAKANRKG